MVNRTQKALASLVVAFGLCVVGTMLVHVAEETEQRLAKPIALNVTVEAHERGEFTLDGQKALNALYHEGQVAFLNTYLRDGEKPTGCYLFLLGPSLALAPGKTATMATLVTHELSVTTNTGYARKQVTFGAPALDAGTNDYYAQAPVVSWTKEERTGGAWATPIAWIGLVCGGIESATQGNGTGTLVSLAQVSPSRNVGTSDTVSAGYKVFQR